jgi:hypothetical protein
LPSQVVLSPLIFRVRLSMMRLFLMLWRFFLPL